MSAGPIPLDFFCLLGFGENAPKRNKKIFKFRSPATEVWNPGFRSFGLGLGSRFWGETAKTGTELAQSSRSWTKTPRTKPHFHSPRRNLAQPSWLWQNIRGRSPVSSQIEAWRPKSSQIESRRPKSTPGTHNRAKSNPGRPMGRPWAAPAGRPCI